MGKFLPCSQSLFWIAHIDSFISFTVDSNLTTAHANLNDVETQDCRGYRLLKALSEFTGLRCWLFRMWENFAMFKSFS